MKKTIITERPVYTQSARVAELKAHTGRISSTDSNLRESGKTVRWSGRVIWIEALKNIVKGLDSDTQQQLLDFLLLEKNNREPSSDQQRKLNMFTDSLATELGRSLGNSTRIFPLPFLGQARRMLKDVDALMDDLKMSNLKTADTKVMYNLIARVLVHQAHVVSAKVKVPVSMKLVLQTTTPLHSLIDNHFPNYLKSGLMSVVLTSARNGIQQNDDDD